MARKNSGVLDDLMEITARLPWQVGIALAVATHFILHYYATQAPLPTNPAELKVMGKTMGESVVSGVFPMLAGVLQYLVPFVLVIGAAMSAMRRRNQKEASNSEVPECPNCGKSMVRRTAKSGSNAGNPFWGCSQYPKCRGVRN